MAKIEGFLPDNDGMKKAFTGADMVIIPAGIPRKYTFCDTLRVHGHVYWLGAGKIGMRN